MQTRIISLFIIILAINACSGKPDRSVDPGATRKVEIREESNGFMLYADGEPYFIKGAVGWDFLEELAGSGANSLRSGPGLLDEAHQLGLSVLVNIRMGAERDGFDYNDEEAVRYQFENIRKIVEEHKNHHAVLMWAVGNELDHIPGNLEYNLKLWDAVNDIAGMIKEIDPYHPVLTVVGVGEHEKEKFGEIMERCPNIDLLGINGYAAIMNVPRWLKEFNWNKPYVVTEWGPSGWWEVPRTNTGVVIEETSSEKARVYRERYEKVILADPLCIGSYVFLWTSNRQERTHTWFNMFHNDLRTETVEVMEYMWTGKWPENRAPRIESLTINGRKATDNLILKQGSINSATVRVADPDNDNLTTEWELLPEPVDFAPYAGQGEVKPEPVSGFIIKAGDNEIRFEIPAGEGVNYRLFVYVYDGQGNVGNANIPFYASDNE
jgi:hypothetical protein